MRKMDCGADARASHAQVCPFVEQSTVSDRRIRLRAAYYVLTGLFSRLYVRTNRAKPDLNAETLARMSGKCMSDMSNLETDGVYIATDGLSYDYNGVTAVSKVGITVAKGQIVALIGANGAGKSTTVKMIAGALKPRTGRVLFGGRDITGMPAHKVVQQGIALVPESRLVFRHLTVLENLQIAGHLPRSRDRMKDSYDHVFQLFPRLYERRAQHAGSLSGGEQQMLA
ncbi:MAG: ATP-binding cassette domain-containing protein, partial [Rhodobacteraceae bacterium]|nr:ATP-binding cassette domain-containing protein [Paracoccaceae bacterium]